MVILMNLRCIVREDGPQQRSLSRFDVLTLCLMLTQSIVFCSLDGSGGQLSSVTSQIFSNCEKSDSFVASLGVHFRLEQICFLHNIVRIALLRLRGLVKAHVLVITDEMVNLVISVGFKLLCIVQTRIGLS